MIIHMENAPADEGNPARPSGWRPRSSALAVAAVSLLTVAAMAPHLLPAAVTPTGGDMGAHVLVPAYLRDVLLPGGRIMGWSNYWFAGFPVFYFYFPLPFLAIVGLDLLLPYGVAFKLVTVMGLAALAPASYFLVRSMKFSRPVSAAAAAAGGAYAFMETPTPNIFGGTIASSLAGEFSYSWSFALMLVYLGLLLRAVYDDRRYLPWAAAALAATALCHVIPTIAAVAASLFLVIGRLPWRKVFAPLWKEAPGMPSGRRTWWVTAGTWLFGFALAAFWALPLVIRLRYTTDMGWHPLRGFDELFPVEFWPIALLGSVGMAAALRAGGRIFPLAALTLIPAPAFFLLSQGAKLWNGRVLPHWFFGMYLFAGIGVGLLAAAAVRRLPPRISPWWIRGGLAAAALLLVFGPNVGGPPRIDEQSSGLAGWTWWDRISGWAGWDWLGMEAAVDRISGWAGWDRISGPDLLILAAVVLLMLQVGRWGPPNPAAVVPICAVMLLIGPAFLGAVTGENYTSGWARWNYQGYEAKEKWPEYRNVMRTMSRLPEGRVQWEANNGMNEYGTPMALMLFPYWTGGTHPSMEGLYFESSITTPFHFLNTAEVSAEPSNPISGLRYHTGDYERGARHMELFNVAYYVAYTDTAREQADRHPAFERLAESAPFTIYSLPESSLVDVAVNRPWVFEEPEGRILDSLLGIFTEDEETEFVDVALDWYEDLDLLDQWVVADGPEEWERITPELDGGAVPIGEGGGVSDVVLEDHRIAFRTSAVGRPHMIKVSYFPNWRASGAEGPWRAAPSFMVVIPTEEQVELRFENTWVEEAGAWSSFLAAALLALWAGSTGLFRRRQRTQAAAQDDQPA